MIIITKPSADGLGWEIIREDCCVLLFKGIPIQWRDSKRRDNEIDSAQSISIIRFVFNAIIMEHPPFIYPYWRTTYRQYLCSTVDSVEWSGVPEE